LEVYTAYEYLESRFDLKTRQLTAILFLVQRGLAAGITIYAPAIILSSILGWNLVWTVLFIGIIVIFYTVFGGTKAVSVTQKQQMIIILTGMILAAIIIVFRLPEGISFNDALGIAGKMGKLEVVDFKFDLTELPMQFLVLFVGILVFVFFLFVKPPIHFNQANVNELQNTPSEIPYQNLSRQYDQVYEQKQVAVRGLLSALQSDNDNQISQAQQNIQRLQAEENTIRQGVKDLIIKEAPSAKTKDTDYVFITFVMNYLPIGLVGLLLAVIFSAAMSSTASELNALATTTAIDLYKRSWVTDRDDAHYLKASKWITIIWGTIALSFALVADLFDNLIQAVNIIGSLFYGAILGVFLVAFFFKQKDRGALVVGSFTGAILGAIVVGIFRGEVDLFSSCIGGFGGALIGYLLIQQFFTKVGSNAIFFGAILGEICVLFIYYLTTNGTINLAYLWLNLIGCVLVIFFSLILAGILKEKK